MTTETVVTETDVSSFLKENPSFTRTWFLQNIGPLTLRQWMRTLDGNHNDHEAPSHRLRHQDSLLLDTNDAVLTHRMDEGRNSITQQMFYNLISGRHKEHYTMRTPTELLQLSEIDRFMELIRDIANELDVDILCHKILTNVSILTNSDRGSLFLLRGPRHRRFLVSKLFDVRAGCSLIESLHTERNQIRVPLGKGIAGTVALAQKPVNITDAYKDERFNQEVDRLTGYKTRSLLCLPILNYEGETVGVAQIVNKSGEDAQEGFTEEDEQVFRNYLTFCGIGLTNAQLFEMSVQEYKRNQLLLSLAKGIFAEQQNLDKLVEKILLDSHELLHCQRCCVYLVEQSIEGDTFLYKGLYSQAVDNCHGRSLKYKQGKEIYLKHHDAVKEVKRARSIAKLKNAVFTKAFELQIDSEELTGTVKNPSNEDLAKSRCAEIARKVATTGKILNVSDTVSDPQLGEEIRDYDGFVVHSILSLPIRDSEERVIGVVQLMNKIDGKPFLDTDVNVVEAFAIFCGLGIHNCQMYESVCKLMARQSVALEVLSYHAMASKEETDELVNSQIPSAPELQLFTYEFNDLPLSELQTCQATVRMFMEMGVCSKFNVPYEVLCRWTLSVKRNYRPVMYHNWRHAFNVAQTMFTMLYTGKMKRLITDLEMFSLVVACLSHDLDHRGTNNAFQMKVESPLAQLYTTSTMEHHHFDQCIMILNSEGNNIFMHLSPREYREAIKVVESAILSTDLALYFKKRGEFQQLVADNEKSWKEPEKREILRGMMMTACDVAAITKPWEIQREVAQLVAAEFFEQGDLERSQLQSEPIAMMDRKKKDELPKMQVGFIDAICIPVYTALAQVEKGLSPLKDGCLTNRNNWQNMADEYEKMKDSPQPEEPTIKAQPRPENENDTNKLGDSPMRKISNQSQAQLNNQQKQNTVSNDERMRKISNHSIRNKTRKEKKYSTAERPEVNKSKTCTIL